METRGMVRAIRGERRERLTERIFPDAHIQEVKHYPIAIASRVAGLSSTRSKAGT